MAGHVAAPTLVGGGARPPEPDRPTYSRVLTAALRRADGFIAVSQQHWDMLNQRHRLEPKVLRTQRRSDIGTVIT